MEHIFRILSYLVTTFILVPLSFLMYLAQGIFQVVNNFTYHVWKQYQVPWHEIEDMCLYFGVPIEFMQRNFNLFFKIGILFFTPIQNIFVNFHNAVKTIKY
jgi:uncharacterized membrane protein HdeD (DUF308 family)